MPLRKRGIWEVKEIVYIIYTISLSPYIAFPCKILNGMMTLQHDDIMTWRPDCMMPCKSMSRWWAVCGSKAGRRRGGILFFWQTSANSLQKPTTLSANSHKSFQQNFHQTFSNFHQTFSKSPKKGWKSGLLSLFLSPTFPRPSKIRRARKIPIPLHRQLKPTRPADGAGLL